MNDIILKELFSKGRINSRVIKDFKVSSYTYQKNIMDLYWMGVISKNTKKFEINLLDNPISNNLKKLYFYGFDFSLISKKNLEWLSNLIEPRTVTELSKITNLSNAQTNNLLNKFMQFLSKKDNKYQLSYSNQDLFNLINLIKLKIMQNYVWLKGEEKLEKIPLDFQTEGTLTAFSRFNEYGFLINPSHNYVYFPKRELSFEEILVHAIKFSDNPNDLALCILFYLKNKNKAKISEIEEYCEKLGVIETWFDIIRYIDDQLVKNQSNFLPREEFEQKTKLYSIKTNKRYNQETIQKLFKEISNELIETIPIYFIGGNALIEHKTKNSTKDIDIVLTNEKKAALLVNAFKKIGFNELAEKEFQYEQLETSTMLQREIGPRIDLFVNKICDALEFSENMQKRSKKITSEKAEIYLSSLEDVFLLKSISSRDSDLIDCENILQKNILDWRIIYNEIIFQQKNLKQTQELIILAHLEALEKRMNIKIPLTKKITALCLEKSILYLAEKPISIEEIQQKIDFSQTAIRNRVNGLIKKEKLIKTSKKPFKIIKKE